LRPGGESPPERRRLSGVIATQRRLAAKRLTSVPSMWMCIPMWARLWDGGRRLLGRGYRSR
jgi:hypothetical protein